MERLLYAIGEALNQAYKLDPMIEEGITNFAHTVALRNLLGRAYWKIDRRLAYGLFEGDLSLLIEEIGGFLASDRQ